MAVSWWEKKFIANLHASLDSRCKSRISKISTRCPWGVHSPTFDPEHRNEFNNFSNLWGNQFSNFWSWTEKCKIYIDIFYWVSCNIKHITAISNCILNRKYSTLTCSNGPQLMGERFMANLHASLDSTCKSRISKMSAKCQIWGVHSMPFLSWNQK